MLHKTTLVVFHGYRYSSTAQDQLNIHGTKDRRMQQTNTPTANITPGRQRKETTSY